MSVFLSNFGLVIHISQRVAIVRHYKGQLALHLVCWQRCRQDEARADFARDDDLSKFIDRDGFCALQGRSCLPRACTTGEDERLRSQITCPLMRACIFIWQSNDINIHPLLACARRMHIAAALILGPCEKACRWRYG